MLNHLSARSQDDDDALNDLELTDDQIREMIGEDDDDEEGDPLFADDSDGAGDEEVDGEPDSDSGEDDSDAAGPDRDQKPEGEDQSGDTSDTSASPAEGEVADAASTGRPAPDGAPRSDDAATTTAPEPWHFTADGQRVDVPDSAVVDVGGKRAVVIALDAWQRHVQPHLRHQSYWQRREQEFRARDPERHPDVIAARTMTAKLRELLEDDSGEKLHEFAADLNRNRDLLERDVKIAQLEAVRTAEETDARSAREAEEGALLEQQMQAALRTTLDQMAKSEFPGLDTERAHNALWTVADKIFGRAERDYPEYGLAKGQVAIKYDQIRALLAPFAGQKAQRADGNGDAATEVERRNKTRLARGRRPAPAARAASSAAPGGKVQRPTNRDEWESSAMSELASIINDAD